MSEPQDIEIGGRRLRYICGGEGTPAVVLEQGFGAPPAESFVNVKSTTRGWPKVFSEIRKITRVATYGRMASSYSGGTRTCHDMMKDLRMLLQRVEIEPPYVFVGHSFGGHIVRLYANEYPDEVAGVVFVDSSHPDQAARFAEVLPAETSDEAPALKRLRHPPRQTQFAGETIDLSVSASLAREAKAKNIRRLIVLSHSPISAFHPGVAPELSARIEQVWSELQLDLTSLSRNSTLRVATAAGHLIQLDEPQLLIDAVSDIVRDVRKRSSH